MKRGAPKSKAKKKSPAKKVSKTSSKALSKAMALKIESDIRNRRRNLWIIIAIFGVLLLVLLAIAIFGGNTSGKVISGYVGMSDFNNYNDCYNFYNSLQGYTSDQAYQDCKAAFPASAPSSPPSATSADAVTSAAQSAVQTKLNSAPTVVVVNWIAGFLNIGPTWKQIIIGLVIILIISAGFYDILGFTLMSNDKVKVIISIALGLIAALVGLVNSIVTAALSLIVTLGIAGIFLDIGMAVVIFIGLIFASTPIARFAAKREAQKQIIEGISEGGKAGKAFTALKTLNRSFKATK